MNNLRGAKIIYQESKATQPSHLYFLQKDENYCEAIVTSESGAKRKLNFNVDLSNYYTKNETYSKIEINELLDVIEVTKPELDVLVSENKLEPNRLYKITGIESWCFSQHLIKAIYLKAVTNNTLESEGVGEFYTPKYNNSDSNLGIWKGELLANGMISSASYDTGDKVIWGNLFWENISGNIGTNEKGVEELGSLKIDNYLSEVDWQLITPNDDESLYNIQFNAIKYDLENDYINYRADDLGNVYEITYNRLLTINSAYNQAITGDPTFIYYLNAISLFQWGRDNVYSNIINDSFVSNCNYNPIFFYDNTVENSNMINNNFLNVSIIGNNFKNASIVNNYLKTYGGLLYNTLENSNISLNKYYFEISYNNLKYNSSIYGNNDNNIIVGTKYSIIKGNNLDNFSTISNNIFVEEGNGVSGYRKGIYDNVLTTYCNINSNTIKNGSRIYGHTMNYYSTINGNTLDTDSNIYNNQLIQNGKIDNNILTGHGRIYGNQLDRQSEITNCKLRISPATSYASTIKGNRLFTGKIQNVDFGNIVNPIGSDPNNPAFGGNTLSECIIENESIIKDLTFPNHGGVEIQFVKMNGASEFKNITINDSIRNVDFINTIFNETSDYSKLIEGSGYQTNGFTKTYIDGVLLQDRFDEKQDVLTEDNVGQFMDLDLPTKLTPTSGDTVLGRDSLTGKAVEIPASSFIDNLQIGGRNLALNSKGFLDQNTDWVRNFNLSENLILGQQYTVTVRVRAIQGINDYFGINDVNGNNSFPIVKKSDNVFSFSFIANHASNELVLTRLPYGTSSWYQFDSFKIEKGNKATDWTPAPEDKADLVDGKVPSSQLPSYVDDVLEFANLASFPTIGESGKIYIATDTNITYRWSGTSYAEISASLALGETASTAYRGDRGKIAYGHSQTTGNPHDTELEELTDVSGDATSIIDTDVILKKEVVGGFWKKITWANIKATLKTYFDGLYAPKSFNVKVTTPSSWVTGTMSETEVLRIEIPANSLSASDLLTIPFLIINKQNANGTILIKGKLSTSNTMPSGSTDQIFQSTLISQSNLYAAIDRHFIITSGEIKGIIFTSGITSDITNTTVAISSKPFDRTVTNYLYISITLGNTSDQARLEGMQLTNS